MKAEIIINCLLAFFGLVNPVFGQQLSPAQQMADFDTLCAKLEYVHPDLYLYQSREEYENYKTKINCFYQHIRLLSENSTFCG